MKKFMCLIIAAVLICGSAIIPVNNIHEEVVTVSAEIYNEVPDGYTGIYTIDDLYSVRNNLSSNYILMNDIDMSETAPGGDWDNGNGWLPIDGFSGIFDGNGYAIKNMHIYGEINNRNCIGLFGYCEKAKISKLALVNCHIDIKTSNSIHIGTIVGNASGSSYLLQSYANGSINVEIEDASCYIGGLCGENGLISQCFNNCDISVKHQNEDCTCYIGGIVSRALGPRECYNTGLISIDYPKSNRIGAIIAYASSNYWTENCCYLKSSDISAIGNYNDFDFTNVTGLTEAQMKSKSAFTGFDFDEIWTIDPTAEYPYPTLINVPYVNTQSSVVEPTQPTTKPSAETKKGDINGDGLVDSVDASLILAYYAYISSGGKIDNIDEWMQNG